MFKKLKPLGNQVILEEIKKDKATAGLVLPYERSEGNVKEAKVLAVGDGFIVDGKKQKLEVKVGDTVLFQWGEHIEIENKKYYFTSEGNILAVYNK